MTNSKESLLLDWSVNSIPLVSRGSATIGYSEFSGCRNGLYIGFQINCDDDSFKVCRRTELDIKCR